MRRFQLRIRISLAVLLSTWVLVGCGFLQAKPDPLAKAPGGTPSKDRQMERLRHRAGRIKAILSTSPSSRQHSEILRELRRHENGLMSPGKSVKPEAIAVLQAVVTRAELQVDYGRLAKEARMLANTTVPKERKWLEESLKKVGDQLKGGRLAPKAAEQLREKLHQIDYMAKARQGIASIAKAHGNGGPKKAARLVRLKELCSDWEKQPGNVKNQEKLFRAMEDAAKAEDVTCTLIVRTFTPDGKETKGARILYQTLHERREGRTPRAMGSSPARTSVDMCRYHIWAERPVGGEWKPVSAKKDTYWVSPKHGLIKLPVTK